MSLFALESTRAWYKEETAIMNSCILNRDHTYKLCRSPKDCTKECVPCGTVKWCEKFLPKEKTVPDYYPEFLKEHLHRKVWRADKWPLGARVFIKPADRHKRFDGFITSGGYRKKKKGPYWCSEVVTFMNEWRYYVSDGKVMIAEWYQGDEVNEPDPPRLEFDLPDNFCGALDFGTLKTGQLALVEANAPYACGTERKTRFSQNGL